MKKRPSVVISITGKTLAEVTEETRNRSLGIQTAETQETYETPKPPAEKEEKKPWWKKLFS